MANLLLLLLLSLTTIFTAAHTQVDLSGGRGRDYTNCNSSFRDVTLYQAVIDRPAKLLQVVSADEDVSTGNAIIHCIRAVEQKPEGAAVSLTRGGLGYNFVSLHFESQRGHGIHYNITISGK